MVINVLTCLWYAAAVYNTSVPLSGTWLGSVNDEDISEAPLMQRYLASLYFTVSGASFLGGGQGLVSGASFLGGGQGLVSGASFLGGGQGLVSGASFLGGGQGLVSGASFLGGGQGLVSGASFLGGGQGRRRPMKQQSVLYSGPVDSTGLTPAVGIILHRNKEGGVGAFLEGGFLSWRLHLGASFEGSGVKGKRRVRWVGLVRQN